jgi:hypothetical protein
VGESKETRTQEKGRSEAQSGEPDWKREVVCAPSVHSDEFLHREGWGLI